MLRGRSRGGPPLVALDPRRRRQRAQRRQRRGGHHRGPRGAHRARDRPGRDHRAPGRRGAGIPNGAGRTSRASRNATAGSRRCRSRRACGAPPPGTAASSRSAPWRPPAGTHRAQRSPDASPSMTTTPPRAPALPRRVDVLGVGVSAIDMAAALRAIEGWVAAREQHFVCVTNVHVVMEAQRDAALKEILNGSGLTTPDGMPLVWAAHRAGAREVRRVYGPDLMLALSERAAARGWSSYYYGGRPGVAERLAARLQARYPGLRVAGCEAPPFRALGPDEDAVMVERLNAARPDLVWVGLGAPKQEHWMGEHVGRLEAPVLLGVGAAFDIHAGTLAQAPGWMQRMAWSGRTASRASPGACGGATYTIPRFVSASCAGPPGCVRPQRRSEHRRRRRRRRRARSRRARAAPYARGAPCRVRGRGLRRRSRSSAARAGPPRPHARAASGTGRSRRSTRTRCRPGARRCRRRMRS